MKKILLFFVLLVNLSYSQSILLNNWTINGNSVATNTAYIGTNNAKPFLIKTNSLTAVTIGTNQVTSVTSLSAQNTATLNGLINNGNSSITGSIAASNYSASNTSTFTGIQNNGNSVVTGSLTIGNNSAINTSSLANFHVAKGTSTISFGEISAGSIGIWGNVTPNANNYIFNSNGTRLLLNTPASGGDFFVNSGNATTLMSANNTSFVVVPNSVFNKSVRIGNTTIPTATLDVTGTMSVSSTSTLTGLQNNGDAVNTGSVVSTSKTAGIGYAVGSGSTVTQGTSRTTGVTINAVTGQITLFSAAGSTSWQSFTVTNSAVTANDLIIVEQKTGTDLYMINVTAISAGSFRVTFATTGGTTTEQPVFSFAVIKGQTN